MKASQEQRASDRVEVLLPVQLWGMESEWGPFTEKVEIANVSLSGARMKRIPTQLRLGDVVAVEHAGKKAAFQVVWIGKKGSAHEGEAGIFCLEPAKLIWGTILLSPEMAAAAPKLAATHVGRSPGADGGSGWFLRSRAHASQSIGDVVSRAPGEPSLTNA